MHLGSWRQRILITLGLLLVVVPIVGLPILIKNILVVAAGLFLITIILTVSNHEQVAQDQSSEVLEKEEVSLPSVYDDQTPEFYVEVEVPQKFSRNLLADKPTTDLVPSPLKTKTVRRRVTKTTKLKPIEDHASVV